MPTTFCGFNDGPGYLGRDLLVQRGPTLFVNIGFDSEYDLAKGAPPKVPSQIIEALVDSGATESCIDSGLAMSLNLPVVDQRKVAGVGGAHDVNMHLAQIFIPSLNYTIHGAFAGVSLAAGGQQHLALIGRTFLRNFVMVYNGLTGTVALSNDPLPQQPAPGQG
jgi:hypothetical protein